MFSIDVIFWVDSTVHVGIEIDDSFNSNSFDVFTFPSSFTGGNEEWTITEDVSVIWTVFISPDVFRHNNTSVDFTGIKHVVTIEITIVS